MRPGRRAKWGIGMETNKKICAGMETKLAELLLDPVSAPEPVRVHVSGCEGCRSELEALRATMNALDAWEVPEPNPYFMTRFEARLREEQQTAPSGWLERLAARLKYGPQMHVRPLAAMALTVMLLLGGGAYLDIAQWEQPAGPPDHAAVVHDLQVLDNNSQLLDQLESISDNNNEN